MNAAGIIAIVLVIIVLALGVLYFIGTLTPNAGGLGTHIAPQSVLVSGKVTTTGFGTSPSEINFTSQRTGQSYSTTIDGNGEYSVSLLGADQYNVTVFYESILGKSTSPTCSSYKLLLNSTVSNATLNVEC
jgi:hypothetical protein